MINVAQSQRKSRYPNVCERCGKRCKGTRCAKCRLIVACACGCGVEAHLSSSDYGNPGATARARTCLTRQRARQRAFDSKCEMCGETFDAKRRRARFCSLKCSQDHARATMSNRVRGQCEICGAEFYRKASDFKRRDGNTGGRFCSKKCQGVWISREAASARAATPKPPKSPRSRVWFRKCKVCGRLFCGRSPSACYCSDECRYLVQLEVARQRGNGLYAAATEYVDGQYRGANYRKGLLIYLVERDGDRCAICHRRVDITLKSGTRGSRRGPSVDHIIPRSKGGSDDPVNLRLTHWGCNQKRGNRGGNEQLALVG